MADSKVSRFWFVIPSDLKGDGRMWDGPSGPVRANADRITWADTEPARAARAPARGTRAIEPEPVVETDPGVGLYLTTKEAKEIVAFTTEGKAIEYAKHQASLNPSRLFGVFGCSELFETAQPTILKKAFNNAGELVLVEGS